MTRQRSIALLGRFDLASSKFAHGIVAHQPTHLSSSHVVFVFIFISSSQIQDETKVWILRTLPKTIGEQQEPQVLRQGELLADDVERHRAE